MRGALIISLLLAVAAAVFAIQNPNETSLNIGPYEITASTALVIIGTFILGAIVGILASLPGRMRQRKRVKQLERGGTTGTTTGTTTMNPYESPTGGTTY
ncbi:MAG TPA: LapA family protein [Rhodothermales bacterium]